MICFYQPTESLTRVACVAGNFVGKLESFCYRVIKLTKAISFQFIYSLFWETRACDSCINLLFPYCIPPFRNPTVNPKSTAIFNHHPASNRTQSNLIEFNRTNGTQSNAIVRSIAQIFLRVRLCSITELNRTQSRDCVRLTERSIWFD